MTHTGVIIVHAGLPSYQTHYLACSHITKEITVPLLVLHKT